MKATKLILLLTIPAILAVSGKAFAYGYSGYGGYEYHHHHNNALPLWSDPHYNDSSTYTPSVPRHNGYQQYDNDYIPKASDNIIYNKLHQPARRRTLRPGH